MSIFAKVEPFPPDPVFGIGALFQKDSSPNKVDLTVGVYRNQLLQSEVMQVVKEAEKEILEKEKTKTYLMQAGKKDFVEESKKLIFSSSFLKKNDDRIFGAQSVGGTGALRIGGEFLAREISKKVFISDPTWPNHRGVFEACGMQVETYPYYNRQKRLVDFDSFLAFLGKVPEKSIIVLHTCCHNPTGCDLTLQQWKELSLLFAKKKLIPFFDTAYLGFSGEILQDSFPIQLFAEEGHEFFISLSFSKSFGLYAERIGAFFLVSQDSSLSVNTGSVIKRIIRVNYSNPPVHGASIVSTILQSPLLRKKWEGELLAMRSRIEKMRKRLVDALTKQVKSDDCSFLLHRFGLFSLLPLQKEEVMKLSKNYSIYMTLDGRINLTGLNEDNFEYVIEAITKVKK